MKNGRMAFCLLLVCSVGRAETHRLKPTVGHPTFAVRPPILTVKPGDVVESESLWGEWYEKAGGKWPGEVGPIAIAGAEPGDTLIVEIRKCAPTRHRRFDTGRDLRSARSDEGTAMLRALSRGRSSGDRPSGETGTLDLEERGESVTVTLKPMPGGWRWLPRAKRLSAELAGPFGGNIDAST